MSSKQGKTLAIFVLRLRMTRILSSFLLLMLLTEVATAQLVVDQSYTPQQLIEEVLTGQGVEVSNFQFSGNAQARGYFNGANSNIGLSEGVIISTGKVSDAPGPNGTPASDDGTEFIGPGDPVLSGLSGLVTNDAAVLEFDFVPISDTVQFRYVFASNEYKDFVGATYNDVFAFLISGPGITGEENVALIPGTTTPVAINNVSHLQNSQYFIDNEDPPGLTVEYNGFTTVFTALAVLQPCQSYHIRLAIADGGDYKFDSAVFLEARSFSSPSITIIAESSYSSSPDPNVQQYVEGCSSVTLSFERSEPLTNSLSANLQLSGSATNGVDITNIPTFISFAPGQAVATITFQVLDDGQVEGQEDMTITLEDQTPCPTSPPPSITFTIDDAEAMTLQITPDESLTCPEERDIEVTAVGGYPPYTYDWSGSTETTAIITVFPFNTTTYEVEVTDACGFTETAESTISLLTYQVMDVTVENVTVCAGEEVTLEATVLGGRQPLTYQWPDGSNALTYTYTPTDDETITFQVTDDCNITESDDALVDVVTVEASFTYQLIAHATVQFTSTTEDVYTFLWEFGDDSTGVRRNPVHEYMDAGDYPVSMYVRNQDGCETTVYDTVTVYDPLHVYIPNAFTPNGDSLNDWFGVVGEGYLYYDMAIYDRWGQILMEGRFEDANAWDGKFKEKLVPSDYYVYRVWVQPPIGIEVKEVGIVNVLPDQ
jgi:gliding motility-associated-like protein